MPRLKRGRPSLEKTLGPLRVPRLHPREFPEAAHFTEVVRGLTAANLKRPGITTTARLQVIDREGVVLRSKLESRVPYTSTALKALGPAACARLLAAQRSVAALHAYVRRELGQRNAYKIPERGRARMIYLWAEEATGRPQKPAGKYHLQREIGQRLAAGATIAGIADEMTEREQPDKNEENRALDKWEMRVKREKARLRRDRLTVDPRSVKLDRLARALLRQRPKIGYRAALLQTCERIRRAAIRRKLPAKTYDDLLNAAHLI